VTFTFIYLMVLLKIPILALLYIVWWAIRQETDTVDVSPSGSPRPRTPHSHPRRPLPRLPRRGPHGGARLPAPVRTRTVVARARSHR
jgi:hypothetical protein